MVNENLNKENLENSSIDAQDYISEIPDKKNILSLLLDKFKEQKEKREQKLLNPAGHKKTQITNRSISSLWSGKSFLSNIFLSLDNVRKSISQKFSPPLPQNTLATEIIGKDSLKSKENSLYKNSNDLEIPTPPIIRPVIKNSQMSKAEKIEITRIDTSAIKKEQTQDNSILSEKTKSTKPSLEQTPVEEHER